MDDNLIKSLQEKIIKESVLINEEFIRNIKNISSLSVLEKNTQKFNEVCNAVFTSNTLQEAGRKINKSDNCVKHYFNYRGLNYKDYLGKDSKDNSQHEKYFNQIIENDIVYNEEYLKKCHTAKLYQLTLYSKEFNKAYDVLIKSKTLYEACKTLYCDTRKVKNLFNSRGLDWKEYVSSNKQS